MNVFIIPEDFRHDQYILKPIIQAMLNAKGVKAKVQVCVNPLLYGITEAMRWERISEIMDRYGYRVDLFILCVDRDGIEHRRIRLNNLEEKARDFLPEGKLFLAENAWQEIEVWVLAGHTDLPQTWRWQDVRSEPHPKEMYFEPFARQKGISDTPDGGRRKLAEEAARNYLRIRQLCPEDIRNLEDRIPSLM